MLITERLKAARNECKLTQQQIADLLGIDRSTYAYYELGVSAPPLESLFVLASVYNTSVEWFFGCEKSGATFCAPENALQRMQAIKELNMTELSGDERQIVALYRIAAATGKTDDLFEILRLAAGTPNEDVGALNENKQNEE